MAIASQGSLDDGMRCSSRETGMLSVALLIYREKLCLALHICRLGEDTLATRIWEEQKAYSWPGLARKAVDICQELGV